MKLELDAFLADSVASSEGKLYIHGAGWNTLPVGGFPARHDRIGIGIMVAVPYTATNEPHAVEIRLEDEDGKLLPLSDEVAEGDPGPIRGEFTVGRPPTLQPGDDQMLAMAINIDGPVFHQPGGYRFVIALDGEDTKVLRFRVIPSVHVGPPVGNTPPPTESPG